MEKYEPNESGTTIDDVLFYVRQGMYDYVNRNKGDNSDDDDDLDDATEDKDTAVNMDNAKKSDSSDNSIVEVPDDFIFSGYMSFRLWGPFAEPED